MGVEGLRDRVMLAWGIGVIVGFPLIPPSMKSASPQRTSGRRGMTLLELTVVLAVLLSFASILFIGARAWKNGADRAGCIIQLRTIQLAVRSYQHVYGYNPGSLPYAVNGTQDIGEHLVAKGYVAQEVFEVMRGRKPCPGGGTYEVEQPDVFPLVGEVYVKCSLAATARHELDDRVEW